MVIMRKRIVLLVSRMLALAFGFVVTGCASTAQTANHADNAEARYEQDLAYLN
jgi:hypothetical protein